MIERNVKLDTRAGVRGMACFMYAYSRQDYDCAFAVMDAGGNVDLRKMIRNELSYTSCVFTLSLPSLLIQGVKRRLQEMNQIRKSFKNWSPTLLEEEILPFIYCENNLKYLQNFRENVKKHRQKQWE